MILRGRQYVTRSGRSRHQGRNDHFWLAPETERESRLLERLRGKGVMKAFTGPIDTPDKMKELERVGRSIDPNLRRRIDRVGP